MDTFTLPLQMQHIQEDGWHIFVTGYLKDRQMNLIVDTGASRTVLDLEIVRSVFPEIDPEMNEIAAIGIGSSIENFYVTIPYFALGGLLLDDSEVCLIDLAGVNESYSRLGSAPIHGIIGGDILVKYRAVIDYTQAEMRLGKDK